MRRTWISLAIAVLLALGPSRPSAQTAIFSADNYGPVSGLKVNSRTLNPTQVKALHTTALNLVNAPASGTVTLVDRIMFASTFNSAAYAGANALEFRYTNASGAKVTADIASSTLNFSTGTRYATVAGVTTELQAVAAAAIVVAVPVADPTNGDSSITFIVWYHTIAAP